MLKSYLRIIIFVLATNIIKGQSTWGKSSGIPNSPNCSKSSQHIIKGTKSGLHAWPWQMLTFFDGQIGCGATLIHPRYAITAAHCTNGRLANYITIFGGFNNVHDVTNSGWGTQIEAIYQNPCYKRYNSDGDISILKLRDEVPSNMSLKLNPARLPENGEMIHAGEGCYATGWGNTKVFGRNQTEDLQEACLPIIDYYNCSRRYIRDAVTSNMICAGYFKGADTCKGDSGGPLVCKRGDVWKLFGVTSWGVDCGLYPGFYTDVTKYISWIKYITGIQ